MDGDALAASLLADLGPDAAEQRLLGALSAVRRRRAKSPRAAAVLPPRVPPPPPPPPPRDGRTERCALTRAVVAAPPSW